MRFEPVIGDKFLFTWEELGKPTVQGGVKVPGFGIIMLDDADVHYAQQNPTSAAFFVRKSKALGPIHYVVVSRVQPA
ncbi:MAG: hypothetical protein MUC92_06980 [Fimbriimonadaceae bacterium]|jgi:hypothetical protein|nr:hypothetical protein [Fimbriimonadaceae bacterium]